MTHYLRTPAVSDYTGISISQLEKLRVSSEGPPFIKAGRSVLYDIREVDAWLHAHRRTSTSDDGGFA